VLKVERRALSERETPSRWWARPQILRNKNSIAASRRQRIFSSRRRSPAARHVGLRHFELFRQPALPVVDRCGLWLSSANHPPETGRPRSQNQQNKRKTNRFALESVAADRSNAVNRRLRPVAIREHAHSSQTAARQSLFRLHSRWPCSAIGGRGIARRALLNPSKAELTGLEGITEQSRV